MLSFQLIMGDSDGFNKNLCAGLSRQFIIKGGMVWNEDNLY